MAIWLPKRSSGVAEKATGKGVNESSVFASKLRWIMHPSFGSAQAYVHDRRGERWQIPLSLVHLVEDGSIGINYPEGPNDRITSGGGPGSTTGQTTLLCVFCATNSVTSIQSLINDDNGSARNFQFRINASAGLDFIPFISNSPKTITFSSALTLNNWYVGIASFVPGLQYVAAYTIDGARVAFASAANAGGMDADTGDGQQIGVRVAVSVGQLFIGKMWIAAQWDIGFHPIICDQLARAWRELVN